MKKLILTLLITLSSLVSFTQSSLYGRAYQFQLGMIDINDDIQWIAEPTPVDILIQVNKGEMIIYSEEHQVYQIVGTMGSKDGTTMYKAMDKRGIYCYLFLTTMEDYYQNQADAIAVTVRYSDYTWMYVCMETK
jgi:hypothetical protein